MTPDPKIMRVALEALLALGPNPMPPRRPLMVEPPLHTHHPLTSRVEPSPPPKGEREALRRRRQAIKAEEKRWLALPVEEKRKELQARMDAGESPIVAFGDVR